jgi:YggT family protein
MAERFLMARMIHYAFFTYTLMILARIISSWIPELNRLSIMKYVYKYTEPYLGFFRRIIPPLGMIDLSPLAAFFALRLLEGLVINIIV